MASFLDVVISTGAGFVAGIVGSSLNERLKSGVVAVEVELTRLDGLHDKIGDLLALPQNVDRNAALRDANSVRRRVGINLRSLIPDSTEYTRIVGFLSRLDRIIGRAEDGEMLGPETQTELDEIVRGVRLAAKRRSIQARAWWLLRGQ